MTPSHQLWEDISGDDFTAKLFLIFYYIKFKTVEVIQVLLLLLCEQCKLSSLLTFFSVRSTLAIRKRCLYRCSKIMQTVKLQLRLYLEVNEFLNNIDQLCSLYTLEQSHLHILKENLMCCQGEREAIV